MSYVSPEQAYENKRNQARDREALQERKRRERAERWKQDQTAAKERARFLFSILKENDFPGTQAIEIAKYKLFARSNRRIPEVSGTVVDTRTDGYILPLSWGTLDGKDKHGTPMVKVEDTLLTTEGTVGMPLYAQQRDKHTPFAYGKAFYDGNSQSYNKIARAGLLSARGCYIGQRFIPLEAHPQPQLLVAPLEDILSVLGIEEDPVKN